MDDIWAFEKAARRNGHVHVAGIDEAGRGPLAGPVVSAAVILPTVVPQNGITDSKLLSPEKRDALYDSIYDLAIAVGIGIVDAHEIDRINILQASLVSMAIAVRNLRPVPDFLLIDGPYSLKIDFPQQPVINGDQLSISISAASIVAKVTRDRLMEGYHLDYPEFEFCRHKGYATRLHREAIRKFGCCFIHRKTFKGVFES